MKKYKVKNQKLLMNNNINLIYLILNFFIIKNIDMKNYFELKIKNE